MNFIPCLTWVPKGKAKSCPEKLQLSAEELKKLIEETREMAGEIEDCDNLDESDDNSVACDDEVSKLSSVDANVDSKSDNEDFNTRYNLDAYDSDDDKPFMKISDIAMYVDNKDDEYITDYTAVEEDEEEEKENYTIKDDDNLLIVGHVENESSLLEIYVYNQEENSFYVHHDIVLPSYPLALEWLDFDPTEDKPGNFVAVADMSPVIKIWDLDVVEVLEPDFCLGKKPKKSKKSEKKECKYHSDAVLSLSWNKEIRNILASGSADSSIILWDLKEGTVLHKLTFHTNKVQSLQWHPCETSFLLSSCTDGLLKVFDCRTPDSECKSWSVEGEIERVTWSLLDSMQFLCSTDTGVVHLFDLRKDEAVHSVKVAKDAVTGLDMNPLHPEILITASMDRTVKMWNVEEMQLMKSHKLKVGAIYTAKFAPDAGLVLALGGNDDSNNLKVIDLEEKHTAESNEEKPNLDVKDESSAKNGVKKKAKISNLKVQFEDMAGGSPKKKFKKPKFKENSKKTQAGFPKKQFVKSSPKVGGGNADTNEQSGPKRTHIKYT